MLKVGVIGCGRLGIEHIKRLSMRLRDVEVTAVSGAHMESAQRAAGVCGAKAYTDNLQLIADSDVEAVVIVSPGETHAELVLEAIKAGKRVFCEKPLATTAEDCKRVMEAEIESGRHLVQIGFNRRYDKSYIQMKEILDKREVGEPLMIHCTHRNPKVSDSYTTDMAIHDTLIHEIDCIRWLLGEEYESAQVIFPKRTKNAQSHLQDPQFMIITTKGGICIDVEVFVNCNFGYDINCEVVCEEGTVKLAAPSKPIVRRDTVLSTGLSPDWIHRFVDSFDAELQDWIDAFGDEKINGPTAWDGYVAAVATDAFVKAQQSKKIEPIVIDSKPKFYA